MRKIQKIFPLQSIPNGEVDLESWKNHPLTQKIDLSPVTPFTSSTEIDALLFVYVIHGRLMVRDDRSELWVGEGNIGLLSHDSQFACTAGKDGAQFLLVAGVPSKDILT